MSTDQTATPLPGLPDDAAAAAMVSVRGLTKSFDTVDARITAVDGIDLDIAPGTVAALTGASGSGKSTLLHLIGALDTPDEGTITVAGTDITRLRGRQLADYRRSIGFVFQRFNLLPTLTVLDNVAVPLIPRHRSKDDPRERARELLHQVGLAGREHTLATRLSGGQQQRVAIARALMCNPSLLLADEPTGNLDSHTGHEIVELMLSLRESHGTTILLATHDQDLARRCDTTIRIRDGRVDDAN